MKGAEDGMARESGGKYVCPAKHVRLFDNFLRPLVHSPGRLFGPYVKAGMKVLDIGCGRGWASLGLARLVGEDGLVISADLQPEMLEMLKGRAEKADLSERIRTHRCESGRVGVTEEVDFALAFWMVHETPDAGSLLKEVFNILKPGGRFFIAEPGMHVSKRDFKRMIEKAKEVGFKPAGKPMVLFSRAVVLEK